MKGKLASIPPILEALNHVMPNSAWLELGCGFSSTPIIAEFAARLVSIESSTVWHSKVKKALAKLENTTILLHSHAYKLRFASKKDLARAVASSLSRARAVIKKHGPFDIMLVDSGPYIRDAYLSEFYKTVRIAAFHDAEDPRYGYEKVAHNLPPGYTAVVYTALPTHAGFILKCSDSLLLRLGKALKHFGKIYAEQNKLPKRRHSLRIL